MSSYIGVDWAGGCWLVVKTGENPVITTEPSILNVWLNHGRPNTVDSILVDIPIGLLEEGPRPCDEAAKNLLQNRRSSVFSIPGRKVIETEGYRDARDKNGGSLGSQSWWLFPRILEVDLFLQEYPEALEKTYESHPEVCFSALDEDLSEGKKTHRGRESRLRVLEEDAVLHKHVMEIVRYREDGAEWHERISKSRTDDVIDAAVLALTAEKLNLSARSESNSQPGLPLSTEPGRDDVLGVSPSIIYPHSK